jgi:hypothetical protein
MPNVVAVAALIADLGADPGFPGNSWTGRGSGGGVSNTSIEERAVGSNSALNIAGVLFVVLRTSTGTFQMYKSSDHGATWATSGSAFTPTESGGGLCSLAIGTDIYVSYSRGGRTRARRQRQQPIRVPGHLRFRGPDMGDGGQLRLLG